MRGTRDLPGGQRYKEEGIETYLEDCDVKERK
jgi:hypothetical protein